MLPTLANIAFQALSLATVGVFCWVVYYYRAQVVECLKSTVDFSAREGSGTENKRMYDSFARIAMALGALSIGIAATKAAAMAFGTGSVGIAGTVLPWNGAGILPGKGAGGVLQVEGAARWITLWAPSLAAIAAAVATAGISAVKTGVLMAAGGLTLSGKFTAAIIHTKKNLLAAASMTAVPLSVILTGVNPVRDCIVVYLFAIVVVALSLLLVAHTLRSFIKQKVSLLVWILYLCTVEIFPVYAAVLAVTKII